MPMAINVEGECDKIPEAEQARDRLTFDHDESVNSVREYFDDLGEAEWDRLESDIAGRASYRVHLHFMERFIQPGMRVLEIGAGPGRFTAPMVEMGAQVVVTDISPVQLDLNRSHMAEAGVEHGIEERLLLDVCDTSDLEDGSFDAVLAYGGPLSYAFDEAEEALAGLFRVTKAGGPVVASVMSTLGSYRLFFTGVVEIGDAYGEDANDRILETGDLRETQRPGSGLHTCRMFRSDEVVAMAERFEADVLGLSASNWATLQHEEELKVIASDAERWETYVRREIWCSSQPGALDGGTHILFAASRPPTAR